MGQRRVQGRGLAILAITARVVRRPMVTVAESRRASEGVEVRSFSSRRQAATRSLVGRLSWCQSRTSAVGGRWSSNRGLNGRGCET